MKINGIEVKGDSFAWDGCHKIFVIENEDEAKEARGLDYDIYPLEMLEDIYDRSCEYRFIMSWDCKLIYAEQCHNARFESEAVF